MFEAKFSVAASAPVVRSEAIEPIHAMLGALREFASGEPAAKPGSAPSLATRYAAASPLVRRRFDALLQEAETIGTTGLTLIGGRSGKSGPGTAAAAHFLGNSLGIALDRLERLLPGRTA